jgi:hypothetical protein
LRSASFTQTGSLRKIGVTHPPALEAIVFHDQMVEWVNTAQRRFMTRSMALASAVLRICYRLHLFGRRRRCTGDIRDVEWAWCRTAATDLIRNFIFMRAGTDADDLYNNLWSQFEAPLWSEAQSRGRLNRPRLEWFVQTAVQAQTGDEIDVGLMPAIAFVDGTTGLHGPAPSWQC